MLENEQRSRELQIPLSVGELSVAVDHDGKECQKVDVLVNAQFYDSKLQDGVSDLFRLFTLTVACGLIDQRYAQLQLTRALGEDKWTILKNKRKLGEC